MPGLEIKEYLSRIGIRRIKELDAALVEAFGREEGERHIERLTELFDRSEERLLYGAGDTVYLHRQEELVDYWNQSLKTSLLAASFYDRVFFRRAMEYLAEHGSFWSGEIFDMGCGNGILTCFLALQHPDSAVTGLELSSNAISVARELAGELAVDNVQFSKPDALGAGEVRHPVFLPHGPRKCRVEGPLRRSGNAVAIAGGTGQAAWPVCEGALGAGKARGASGQRGAL